jgi:signal peptidase
MLQEVSMESKRALFLVIASALLLLVVALPVIIFNYPGVIGAEGAFIVQTDSMEPEVPVDSLILVYKGDPSRITKGDIITFYTNVEGRTVRITHRVIEASELNGEFHYLTQGDNNQNPDPLWVPEENVIGEVRYIFPGLGSFIETHRSNRFLILLIMLSAALLIAYELWNILQKTKYLNAYKTL